MIDIPHLPNNPHEEIEYDKQQSYIEEWEKQWNQKSLIDMAKELRELAENLEDQDDKTKS